MVYEIAGRRIKLYSCNTAVVGSGTAGFNASNNLIRLGQKDIVLVTEDLSGGTSRNTGSDKQTYYKLTLSGAMPDSVGDMAQTLFDGQCVDGDTALAEAALSVKCFFNLVDIGVPFPFDRYGEYVGYKTDHDPKARATSAGPLTSKLMTEYLQKEAALLGLEIYDKHQVIRILHGKGMLGLLCLAGDEFVLFNCRNIIYATGGPAAMYGRSAYPENQYGASGLAFEAGVRGKNLTEWQYGLASIRPRWNVSGSFMQALPRFVSCDEHGDREREFLSDYIHDKNDLLSRIFLKGYQWPFDVCRISGGSSIIDVLVYHETVIKGRRVYLDFRSNPGGGEEIDFSALMPEAREYTAACGIQFGTPVERLLHMNRPAFEFYFDRGVDLSSQMLEISLCAQHNNGGLAANCWWQTNIEGFFAVGEVCGTHGVYRPGGSALNAGQVGSYRAAQYIASHSTGPAPDSLQFLDFFLPLIEDRIRMGDTLLSDSSNLQEIWRQVRVQMDECGAAIRSGSLIEKALTIIKEIYHNFTCRVRIAGAEELGGAFRLYDFLISQIAYLSAMKDYLDNGGCSRSSSLYYDPEGETPLESLPEQFRYRLGENELSAKVQEVLFKKGECSVFWRQVRPIPDYEEAVFENVWREFRENRNIY